MNIDTHSRWSRPFVNLHLRFRLWVTRIKLRMVQNDMMKTHEDTDEAFSDSDFEAVSALHRHWMKLSRDKDELRKQINKLTSQLEVL